MLLDDTPDYGKAKAGTSRLGSVKGLKDTVKVLSWDSGAVVSDGDLKLPVFVFGLNLQLSGSVHGLHAIQEEV